ncbi:hypothetical protein M422DRAFT_24932 [Sphaerobolus stellatus SS14]|nr:hypothetical protein M422DRAFT_24932 [Sphaerobolus stellatus SS14]
MHPESFVRLSNFRLPLVSSSGAAAVPICSTSKLDADTLVYLAETYLSTTDIQNLSQTSRQMRRRLLFLLFKDVVITGFNPSSVLSPLNCFARFFRVKSRIQKLSDPEISRYIRHVEIRNWMDPWCRALAKADPLEYNMIELFGALNSLRLSTLKTVFVLINSLPRVETISFADSNWAYVLPNDSWWVSHPNLPFPAFLDPGIIRGQFAAARFVKFQNNLISTDGAETPLPSGLEELFIVMPRRNVRFTPLLIQRLSLPVLAVKIHDDDLLNLPRNIWSRLSTIQHLWIYVESFLEMHDRLQTKIEVMEHLIRDTPMLQDLSVVSDEYIFGDAKIETPLVLESYCGTLRFLSKLSLPPGQPITSIRLVSERWSLPESELETMRSLPKGLFSNVIMFDLSGIYNISKEDFRTIADLVPWVKEICIREPWKDCTNPYNYLSEVLGWFEHLETLRISTRSRPADIKKTGFSIKSMPKGSLRLIQFIGVMTYKRTSKGKWSSTLDPIQMGTHLRCKYVAEELTQANQILDNHQLSRKKVRLLSREGMRIVTRNISRSIYRRLQH